MPPFRGFRAFVECFVQFFVQFRPGFYGRAWVGVRYAKTFAQVARVRTFQMPASLIKYRVEIDDMVQRHPQDSSSASRG